MKDERIKFLPLEPRMDGGLNSSKIAPEQELLPPRAKSFNNGFGWLGLGVKERYIAWTFSPGWWLRPGLKVIL